MDLTKFINKFACDEAYYGDHDFITNSQMGHLKKSPLAYQKYKKHGMPDTNALIFGRAFHWAILEPEKFEEKTHIFTGKVRRGKAWDEFKEEYDKDANCILLQNEYDDLKCMQDVIMSNAECQELLYGGKNEAVSCWEDEDSGVFCKGKADKVKKDCVIDLKTTSSGELHSFKGSAYKYGYNRQSAFYMDGFNKSKFIFIVIEKSSPYNLYIYDCSDQFVESGREEYKYLLDVYREYFIDETKVPSQYYYKGLL
jgi:hypothetical protein